MFYGNGDPRNVTKTVHGAVDGSAGVELRAVLHALNTVGALSGILYP